MNKKYLNYKFLIVFSIFLLLYFAIVTEAYDSAEILLNKQKNNAYKCIGKSKTGKLFLMTTC